MRFVNAYLRSTRGKRRRLRWRRLRLDERGGDVEARKAQRST
jgi:hypothetical protein